MPTAVKLHQSYYLSICKSSCHVHISLITAEVIKICKNSFLAVTFGVEIGGYYQTMGCDHDFSEQMTWLVYGNETLNLYGGDTCQYLHTFMSHNHFSIAEIVQFRSQMVSERASFIDGGPLLEIDTLRVHFLMCEWMWH